MNTIFKAPRLSRRAVLKGGALTVGFALAGLRTDALAQGLAAAPRVLDAKEVDAFLAVNGDGTVTVFCGKVDLGQGLRIAIPQNCTTSFSEIPRAPVERLLRAELCWSAGWFTSPDTLRAVSAELRSLAPIATVGGYTLVTRYDDVREVLANDKESTGDEEASSPPSESPPPEAAGGCSCRCIQ